MSRSSSCSSNYDDDEDNEFEQTASVEEEDDYSENSICDEDLIFEVEEEKGVSHRSVEMKGNQLARNLFASNSPSDSNLNTWTVIVT